MHQTLDSDRIDEIFARLGIIFRPALDYTWLAGDGRVVREILTHREMSACLADEIGYATELLARLPADDRR